MRRTDSIWAARCAGVCDAASDTAIAKNTADTIMQMRILDLDLCCHGFVSFCGYRWEPVPALKESTTET